MSKRICHQSHKPLTYISIKHCFILQLTWLMSPRSEAQAHICLPVRGAPGECCNNTLLCCDNFSSSSVVLCAFSALCVYSKFGHHPHPLGYLCAKFRFFRGLHCWDSAWTKIAYSVTQSITHPVYLMSASAVWTSRNEPIAWASATL